MLSRGTDKGKGLRQSIDVITGGASSFQELAVVGSWEVKVLRAGHMDFVDWGAAGPERKRQITAFATDFCKLKEIY